MDLFANELSLSGQFSDIESFRIALAQMMAIRNIAKNFQREVYCNRALASVDVIQGVSLKKALYKLSLNERRSVIDWLMKHGPFWDDIRKHHVDDYLECGGEIVTDTAVGEVAFRTFHSVDCGLVSAPNTEWQYCPVIVNWRKENGRDADEKISIDNFWNSDQLERVLAEFPVPINTWKGLEILSRNRFTNLTFSNDSFKPLKGVPFSRSSANRIIFLLAILNKLATAFDAPGNRSAKGQRIYNDYFVGHNALFSDSSGPEKIKFRNELRFPHPDKPNRYLDCTWHGKEKHLTLRLHFSWSFEFADPIYIVYVGQKLTKQ